MAGTAHTYVLHSPDTTFSPNKCMIGIFNPLSSTKVCKIYRIICLNNQQVAVTGPLTTMEIRKLSNASGGTTLTPEPMDTTNQAASGAGAAMVYGTNLTFTPSFLYRRFIWSTDEPTPGTSGITMDDLEAYPVFGEVWSMGYMDTKNEPIVLRAGEGLGVINVGNIAVGNCDISIFFTLE